jgi:hypothetical protein
MIPSDIVYNFKTKNKEGFTKSELVELLKLFPKINMNKYNDSMLGHTCPEIDGEFVFYVYDVASAVEAGLKK